MNKDKAKELLNAGYSIAEVAEELEVPKKTLYAYARKENLPYNAEIKEGGPKEKRILRLFKQGFSPEDVGRIFKIAPVIIKRIVEREAK